MWGSRGFSTNRGSRILTYSCRVLTNRSSTRQHEHEPMLAFDSCHMYLTVRMYVPHVKWAKIPLTILWNSFLDKMRAREWSQALPLAGPRLFLYRGAH